ncbi:hypothetical protein CTAYLR_010387 [Chrysophaeum taylorii]|uniref:Uncharacterized protein n=1 Tax=Chrysophaeum taylorii TaxID=2483200 RepID=A0AAD7U5Z4_9STRA|nr:hypothetical protein CTAYLR_010387 [Chrysophaeum taylorii]
MTAWSAAAKRGVEDLVDGVREGRLRSLVILRHRKFGASEAVALAAAMRASSSSLTELRCSGHDLSVEGARALGEAIASSSSMRILDAGSATLGNEGAAALAPCARALTTLELEAKGIGDEGLKAVARELGASQRLKELNVARNCFGDDGLRALVAAATKSESLEIVDASDNGRVESGVADFVASGIKELRCQSLRQGAFDVVVAARAVGTSKLERLDVSACELSTREIAVLAPAVMKIKELRIAHNSVTDVGAGAIADALKTEKARLDVLDVSSNEISGRGLAALVASHAVVHLFAHNNSIGDDGASRVASAILSAEPPDRVPLETLGLAASDLGDRGAEAGFFVFFSKGVALAPVVEIGGNKAIGDVGIAALRRACDRRPGLEIAQEVAAAAAAMGN